MSEAYTSGLNFSWPVKGDTNWDTVIQVALAIISNHGHLGTGDGNQIVAGAIASNAVTEAKLRLTNATGFLRARNAAGSADVNIIGLDASNLVTLPTAFRSTSTQTVTTSTALSVATTITILNGASLATTLASGAEGQLKIVVNIASTTATVTPGTTAGANTASIGQHGAVVYWYLSGEWRAIAATRCILSDNIESFAVAGTWTGFSRGILCTGTTYTITTPAGATGQTVIIQNNASGDVTFGGQICATTTCYLYTYTGAAWKRVALT